MTHKFDKSKVTYYRDEKSGTNCIYYRALHDDYACSYDDQGDIIRTTVDTASSQNLLEINLHQYIMNCLEDMVKKEEI